MRLFLVRHGQTPWNKIHRNQGRSDIPLNEYGRELAMKTGQGLANVPFDLCITSPLKRAKETAMLILEGRNIPMLEDDRLMEISFGDYEGVSWLEENWDPKVPKDFLYFFDAPEKYTTPPNGESFESLIARTGEFLNELCSQDEYKDKTILISTHGAALMAMLNNIEPVPLKDFWGDGVHKNCAVSEVVADHGSLRIVSKNKVYYE